MQKAGGIDPDKYTILTDLPAVLLINVGRPGIPVMGAD